MQIVEYRNENEALSTKIQHYNLINGGCWTNIGKEFIHDWLKWSPVDGKLVTNKKEKKFAITLLSLFFSNEKE
jgi:hypothetical protein